MNKQFPTDDEKEVMKKLDEYANQISLPDSLSRKAIEEKLKNVEFDDNDSNYSMSGKVSQPVSFTERASKKKTISPFIKYAGLVASIALLIVCMTVIFPRITADNSDQLSDSDMNARRAVPTTMDESGSTFAESETALNLGAKSYDEVYDALHAILEAAELYNSTFDYYTGYTDAGSAGFNVVAGSDASVNFLEGALGIDYKTSISDSAEYSETNIQVAGVAEGDLVKTDGKYIYVLNNQTDLLSIVLANGGKLDQQSTINPSYDVSQELIPNEMYLCENPDLLVLIATIIPPHYSDYKPDVIPDDYGLYFNYETMVITYDITDRTNPKLLSSVKQQGGLQTSRMSDGILYLISQYYSPVSDVSSLKPENITSYIPTVNGETQSSDCIFITSAPSDITFLTISSIDMSNPGAFVDSKSILAGSGTYYVSPTNIYITSPARYEQGDMTSFTDIVKLSYDKGILTPVATGRIKGAIRDQFSLDETDGYLRVVTTVSHYREQAITYDITTYDNVPKDLESVDVTDTSSLINPSDSTESDESADSSDSSDMDSRIVYLPLVESSTNSLYVLDASLEQTGAIEDLAENEKIYSARFIENTGYFVTFRETDPLFSVDLTDPTNPTIIGELKIPGFSEYLHPYNDHLLLGIGMNADELTGRTDCIKLSMFDISDPADVKEIDTLLLEGYFYSEALYNHKSVLIDVEKNLIGFSAEASDDVYGYSDYLVYGYIEGEGFYRKLNSSYKMSWSMDVLISYNITSATLFENNPDAVAVTDFYNYEKRGLYIDDVLYITNTSYDIKAFNLNDYSYIEAISLP